MRDLPPIQVVKKKKAKLISFLGDISKTMTIETISDGKDMLPCTCIQLEPGVKLVYVNNRCYIDKVHSLVQLTEELAIKYKIEKHFTFE
jgi:hypothetical protein